MSKTLILLFHRDLARSKANAALAKAAAAISDVEVVDVQSEYPDDRIDLEGDAKQESDRLLAVDRIVLQFPVQWYSTPPLLKAWQDAVLTRMYYIFAATEGDKLEGTPLMVAATAGNIPGAYARGGQNHFTVDEILTPLKATAHRCGLPWHEPYLVFDADRLSPGQIDQAARGYTSALERFIAATSTEQKAA